MKKRLTFFLLAMLMFAGFQTYSQTELLGNPGFEECNSNMFGDTFEDWDIVLGTLSKETSIKKSGDNSLKIKATKTNNYIRQDIMQSFTTGNLYELTINYYVATSVAESKDIQIKSYWAKSGTAMDHDADKLKNENTFYTSAGEWKTITIQTTVPEGATSFYFWITIAKGCTAYFDDFSFKKIENNESYINITPESINKAITTINTPVEMQTIRLETGNLTSAVTIGVTGANANFFTSDISIISETATKGVYDIIVTYNPAASGEHSAMLTIDCADKPLLSKTVSLKGSATDPSVLPSITFSPETPEAMTSKVGVAVTQDILVTSKNLSHDITVKVMGEGEGSFTVSTALIPKNISNAILKITFKPTREGSINERIALETTGMETLYINISGEGTSSSVIEKEGDEYLLDISNPLSLLNEKFDNIEHNKAFSIDKWKNVAKENYRAWWGYTFKENDIVTEKTAKATAYNSLNKEHDPYEMWLITPALDFVNSESKMFTFRVMGDYLVENSDAKLELYYMDMTDGELFEQKIEVDMPNTADHNKDWREYHINLEDQNISDVFFMAFKFSATGGDANAAVYYIDDVTYGRTNIPTITSSMTDTIKLVAKVNASTSSNTINVTGENLTEPISITIKGSNPSKFTVPYVSLPLVGGSFPVTFSSDVVGLHQAYIKLSSRGAADVYIPMLANSQDDSGLDKIESKNNIWVQSKRVFIETDKKTNISVYNILGVKVGQYTVNPGVGALPHLFKEGVYIIHLESPSFNVAKKIIIQ